MSATSAGEQHAERLKLRGCHNCVAHDGSRCRRGAPGPHGWPETQPDDWCLQWQHELYQALTWTSPIVGAERQQTQERTPF